MAIRRGPRQKVAAADHQADEYVGRIADPEDRVGPDQQVPQGPAADPGYRRQKREAEGVHALAGGHEGAR